MIQTSNSLLRVSIITFRPVHSAAFLVPRYKKCHYFLNYSVLVYIHHRSINFFFFLPIQSSVFRSVFRLVFLFSLFRTCFSRYTFRLFVQHLNVWDNALALFYELFWWVPTLFFIYVFQPMNSPVFRLAFEDLR